MSMSRYGEVIAPETVRFERALPGSLEQVWAYLTESDKRGLWLAPGTMEPRVGGRVELRFNHADLSPLPDTEANPGEPCRVHGEVTEWDPPRRLSYTWGEAPGEDSEVTFELAADGGGVLLTLTHRRLGDHETRVSVASGWHTHLDILAERLNGRDPRPFWSAHAEAEAHYAASLPR